MLIVKQFGLILLNFRAKTTPLILCMAKWGVHNLYSKVGSTQSARQSGEYTKHVYCISKYTD